MWIPVTFKPVMLGGGGGQIESAEISIWRKIGFKVTQAMVTCQVLFVSLRTLEYVRWGDAGFFGDESKDVNVDLNWDFVPVMLIATESYLIWNTIFFLVFDAGRELNRKIFNEFIRLRGKTNETQNKQSLCD